MHCHSVLREKGELDSASRIATSAYDSGPPWEGGAVQTAKRLLARHHKRDDKEKKKIQKEMKVDTCRHLLVQILARYRKSAQCS